MKIIFPLAAVLLCIAACNNAGAPDEVIADKTAFAAQRFFPVTAYIKGEIYNMKKAGINPLRYTTQDGRTDSVWLKIEEIDGAVSEFLHPEIDSMNLTGLFTEKSFLDQSINAYTLTYDPIAGLPDSMQLKHWDVYIEPEKNTVKRVYLLKEISKSKTLQLTWVNKEWCKIVSIITDETGNSKIEKEEKLYWGF
ncbi:MAG: hypothetical protein WAU23_00210 [Ferruginibacter sp.]